MLAENSIKAQGAPIESNQEFSQEGSSMRLHVTSVFVNDQEKALQFYTEVLGFKKEKDIPMGKFRWLTVKSKQQASDVELLLEPATHPAVEPYRSAPYNNKLLSYHTLKY